LLARLILYCFVIQDFREHNTDTKVHFELTLSEENMAIALAEGLVKKFKLTTTISTSNMHLFDSKGIIKKYDTPEQSMTHVLPCINI
jgi:DNA topoisomerase-2